MIVTASEHRLQEAIRIHAPLARLDLSRQQIQILARACARVQPPPPGQRPAGQLPARPVLTAADHRLIALVAEGLDNTEIAWRLGVTHSAVRNRISRLMHLLDVPNRVRLVVAGFELGVLPVAPP